MRYSSNELYKMPQNGSPNAVSHDDYICRNPLHEALAQLDKHNVIDFRLRIVLYLHEHQLKALQTYIEFTTKLRCLSFKGVDYPIETMYEYVHPKYNFDFWTCKWGVTLAHSMRENTTILYLSLEGSITNDQRYQNNKSRINSYLMRNQIRFNNEHFNKDGSLNVRSYNNYSQVLEFYQLLDCIKDVESTYRYPVLTTNIQYNLSHYLSERDFINLSPKIINPDRYFTLLFGNHVKEFGANDCAVQLPAEILYIIASLCIQNNTNPFNEHKKRKDRCTQEERMMSDHDKDVKLYFIHNDEKNEYVYILNPQEYRHLCLNTTKTFPQPESNISVSADNFINQHEFEYSFGYRYMYNTLRSNLTITNIAYGLTAVVGITLCFVNPQMLSNTFFSNNMPQDRGL